MYIISTGNVAFRVPEQLFTNELVFVTFSSAVYFLLLCSGRRYISNPEFPTTEVERMKTQFGWSELEQWKQKHRVSL